MIPRDFFGVVLWGDIVFLLFLMARGGRFLIKQDQEFSVSYGYLDGGATISVLHILDLVVMLGLYPIAERLQFPGEADYGSQPWSGQVIKW